MPVSLGLKAEPLMVMVVPTGPVAGLGAFIAAARAGPGLLTKKLRDNKVAIKKPSILLAFRTLFFSCLIVGLFCLEPVLQKFRYNKLQLL